MTPTPVPVRLRAYTVRRPASGTAAEASASPKRPRKATRQTVSTWPEHVLVFDTETTIDESQRLNFGCYEFLKWQPDGTLRLMQEGLFYANDLPTRNPRGYAVLVAHAKSAQLRLRSKREFMDKVFAKVAIEMEGLVVGFNLPFDLSRLAIESGNAQKRFFGGFSLALWDSQHNKQGPFRENKFRPRLRIKNIDNKRSLFGFAIPAESVNAGRVHPYAGKFVDARTLAFALSGVGHSLDTACEAFGVEPGKLKHREHGIVTPEYIEYCRRDVLATRELLVRLREEFHRLGLPLQPQHALSPASLAKAALRAMGVTPPRGRAPSVTPADMGRAMNALYGGRAECRVRRVPVPVVTVDFRSMYPTVNSLMRLWPILTAESIRMEDCTDSVRTLLSSASHAAAFDPALWPQLCAFVEILPEADIVPVRAQYAKTTSGVNIGVNYLMSPVPMVYTLADAYASAILTGKPARVLRAWRLVGDGVQAGLRPVTLGGSSSIDPVTNDFFRTIIEERVRVKDDDARPATERKRVSQLLKILANSGSFGIFAQMDREDLPDDTTVPITVFGNDGSFDQLTNTPEDLGVFCFPPLAALITGAARLMLALLERCVTEKGGTYAFCDTDSMAIIATETGGSVRDDITALTWADVRDIQSRFDALNPYDRTVIPGILNIEDVNYHEAAQRTLYAYVVSSKRYALYARDATGGIQFARCSEHGLGYLLNPVAPREGEEKPENWVRQLWQIILEEEHGIAHKTPAWFAYPAVSQISISKPKYFKQFLHRYEDMPYDARIKPFGFVLSAQVARASYPEGYDATHFRLLAPYATRAEKWTSQLWTDAYSGARFAITTGVSYQPGVVRVRTYADVKAEFLAHGETKSTTVDGTPAGASARGLLFRRHVTPSAIHLVGKEANALEFVERGLIGDLSDVASSYHVRGVRPTSSLLNNATAGDIARAFGVSVRTVREWRRKERGS